MTILNIRPIPKPRMVKSDTWKKRKVVLDYWNFKDKINILAKQKGLILGSSLKIDFFLKMPDTWSKKKKLEMTGKPHQQRPDIDNLYKALTDCLLKEDSQIYKVQMAKYWSDEDKICILDD